MAAASQVRAVRSFNRFYTRQIGVLNERLLDGPFSLTETRVLYELAHRPQCTATDLCRDLGLDAGYLSRMLRNFEKQQLIVRAESQVDARKTLRIIPISKTTQRISISRDDKWVFTSDQTKPELVVLDASTNGVATRVTLPGFGYGTASTPDGKYLVVPCSNVNKVAIVDLATFKVAHVIDVPRAPQESLVAPDGAQDRRRPAQEVLRGQLPA